MDNTGRTPGDDPKDTPIEDANAASESVNSSDEATPPVEAAPPEDQPTQVTEPANDNTDNDVDSPAPATIHAETVPPSSAASDVDSDAPDTEVSPTTNAPVSSLAADASLSIPDDFESSASIEDVPTQTNTFDTSADGAYRDAYDQEYAPADSDGIAQGSVADWDTGRQHVPGFYIAPAPISQRMRMTRRRRRYIFYVRHSVRARQAARTSTLVRLAWASAIVTAALILSMITASLGIAASYYQSQQPIINTLNRTVSSRDSVRIYDSRGVLLYQFSDNGSQHSVTIAHVPIQVVNATIAIEDRSFWVNQGIDFTSIVRAGIADLQTHSINQGGSTITQQLIKQNVLNSNETFDRKLREAILSIGMTTSGVYSKSQILEMYLNSIPYGQEAYGIDAAAFAYFGYQDDPATGESAAQRLDLAQASMLAGIPQNPNTNNPLLHPQHAHDRQAQVLDAMVTAGYISKADRDAALAESSAPGFFHPQAAAKNLAPHFVTFVKDQLASMLQTGQLHLTRSGLNVYTTLDLDMQNHVQQYIKDHLYGNDTDDYGHHLISTDHLTNIAGMIVDGPNGVPGAIRVMLGSVDYYSKKIDGQYNVVTQGYRGPGSSFKPIVYATAFSKGWFPGMSVADMPTIFWDNGQSKPYNPLDFNYNQFWGNITLRTALQNSLNIPAVKVMQFAGVDDVRKMAMRMGITQWLPGDRWGLSSVLGTLDVTPYEMVQAYSVFANYGQFYPLHAIDKITDSSGDILYQYTQPHGIQVMSPQVAYLVTSVLSDNFSRAKDFGACSPLYLDPSLNGDCEFWKSKHQPGVPTSQATWPSANAWPAAVKTGTGEDFKDDWTLGYTMDYVGGFWGGNNDHTPMIRIDGITGAAPVWYRSMLYAERGRPKQPFPIPGGVHKINYTSGGITSIDWIINGVTPPKDIGNAGPGQLPCIVFTNDPNSPWRYSGDGGKCQGTLIPGGPSPFR